MNAIEVIHVTKVYRRFGHKRQFATLKSALLRGSLIRDLRPDETFAAVRDVSFTVPAGRTLGVIGRNGSGKSTMLKLVAGITKPTAGHGDGERRISALIELGAGFHPEISGRENVFINGIMLGLSKREITRRFDEIVEFAELEDFIDAPVKTYSSGMYMRLGFAVAIHVDPDVLLVDEVLAVGDEGFTHKCLDKFAEFKRRGKTILLVTHSLAWSSASATRRCGSMPGEKKGMGDPKRVVGAYITDVGSERGSAARRRRRQRAGVDGDDLARRAGVGGAAGSSGRNRGRPAEHVPGDRRALGIARGRDHRRHRCRAATASAAHVFHSGDAARRPDPPPRAAADRRLRRRRRPVQRRRRLLLRHQHQPRGLHERAAARRRARSIFTIDSLDLVEGTYKLDVAVHKLRRLSVRLPPAALHVPREVAHQGRRHLPAAAPLAVLGRHQADAALGPRMTRVLEPRRS